jgi:hypothetical protein
VVVILALCLECRLSSPPSSEVLSLMNFDLDVLAILPYALRGLVQHHEPDEPSHTDRHLDVERQSDVLEIVYSATVDGEHATLDREG